MWLIEGSSITLLKEYRIKADVYLVDAGNPPHEPKPGIRAFTILASSPQKSNYKEFSKDLAVSTLWMPCWSQSELITISPHYHYVDASSIKQRFYLFGGIPRYVFGKDMDYLQTVLDNAMLKCSTAVIKEYLGTTDRILTDEVSHKLLQYKIGSGFSVAAVVFGSEYVKERLPEILVQKQIRGCIELVQDFLPGIPTVASLRGTLFETLAHHSLTAGGTFKVRGQPDLILPKYPEHRYPGILNNLKPGSLPSNTYIRPVIKNFRLIDSFEWKDSVTLMCFQMTVSKKHVFDQDTIEKLGKDVGAGKLEVYFVVPDDIYSGFALPNVVHKKDPYDLKVAVLRMYWAYNYSKD